MKASCPADYFRRLPGTWFGRVSNATTFRRRINEMESHEVLAHIDLARAYLEMDLVGDAIEELELVRRSFPDDERVRDLADAIRRRALPLK